jgi:hypothetical protein
MSEVGLLGRVSSSSQGRCLHTGQHRHRIKAHRHPRLKWDSIPASEGEIIVHALDRTGAVTGSAVIISAHNEI